MQREAVERLMELYPRIFFACHARHVRDPKTKELVTAHQASILDHLDEEEPMSLKSLASHMGVTPATMCIAIENLVQKGYVSRARSEGDRRMVLLRLTPDGVQLRDAQSVLEPKRVEGMLAELSESELDRGLQGLEVLAQAAGKYLAKKGPGWKEYADD